MIRYRLACALAVVLGITGCQTTIPKGSVTALNARGQPPLKAPEYKIREGMSLEIKHFYHNELSETVKVRLDGRISLPLIDEIQVAGRTPGEIDRLLTDLYAKHVLKPDLTVIVRNPASPKAFIGGEVLRPGTISLEHNTTVLQALMEVGGFRPTGESRTVVVLRNQGTQVPQFIVVNMQQQLSQPGSSEDFTLQHQDIVFVPASEIAKANQFIEQYIDNMLPFIRSVNLNYDVIK